MVIAQNKTSLRQYFQTLRHHLPASDKQAADKVIAQKLIQHPWVETADTLCCYISFAEEVNTHPFINWALNAGKTVCVPKVEADSLTLHPITSLSECVAGHQGILEPPDSTFVYQPDQIDLFIVLGLAFDARGYRLGYGKGYTDRLLAKAGSYRAIGVCHTDQLVFALPHDDYDLPVQQIVTETIVISP